MKICHRAQSSLIDWSSFKFMVFDVPNHSGTYEDRYNHLCMYNTTLFIYLFIFYPFLVIDLYYFYL